MQVNPWKKGDAPVSPGYTGLLDMTSDDYHADPCDVASLSSSTATKVVLQSPFHAWLHHPRYGAVRRETTKEMHRGSIIHGLVFGENVDVVLIDEKDFRKKDAQHARDSALAEGRIPFLLDDYREAEACAAEIRDAVLAAGIDIAAGNAEVAGFWNEKVAPEDARAVNCRCRFDFVDVKGGVILDLKNTSECSRSAISRSIANMGYDIQWRAYVNALERINPNVEGRVDFLWLFVEELPEGSPQRVITQIVRATGLMRELGTMRWGRAIRKWQECTSTDTWPAYAEGPILVDPPNWMVKEEMGDRGQS